jgi:hypothetical protein
MRINLVVTRHDILRHPPTIQKSNYMLLSWYLSLYKVSSVMNGAAHAPDRSCHPLNVFVETN